MNRIILKPGEEKRLLEGHPWVYDNEIAEEIPDYSLCPSGKMEGGCTADVESSGKKYIGRAFFNPASKIRCRIFSGSKEGVDTGFFKRRIRQALLRRLDFYDPEKDSFRLVFAEADFLPGLIVDRYAGRSSSGSGSWLSVQFLTLAMECRKQDIVQALLEVLSVPAVPGGTVPGAPLGIVERNEAGVRILEGMETGSGIIYGSVPEEGIIIEENGLPFLVDLLGGQKTGYFLDQKENRAYAAGLASGKKCLDACCHTGGFAVQAARAGALSVTAVDVSARALEAVDKNASLNGVSDRIKCVKGDVFDILAGLERAGERFGWIVLDPPAFAKTRASLAGAERGYRDINVRAMRLLEKGGILVTCSCSYAMTENRFRAMVSSAARDAGRRLHMIAFRHQSPDHPVLEGFDESLYLKCGVYRVL